MADADDSSFSQRAEHAFDGGFAKRPQTISLAIIGS